MSKSLAEKISNDVEHTVDEVVHDLRKVQKHVRARADETADAVSGFAADAGERAQVLAKKAAQTVRDRPVMTVAIAAGVATILGFIIGRVAPRRV
jgi:ElaB/YqjD/DUF883 family membrane-anchored ribosome-binding protein